MPNGTIRLIWAGGEDDFCVAQVKHVLALEEACGAGVAAIFGRLMDQTWRLNDVRETIRLGLIGGGKSPEKAMALVKLHLDANPLGHGVMIAQAILQSALVGVPDDPLGKPAAADAQDPPSTTMTDASAAVESTASEPPSASPPETSTTSPSGSSPPPSPATTPPTATPSRRRRPSKNTTT